MKELEFNYSLETIEMILIKLERAARQKIAKIKCAKASEIFNASQGYFSQIANGKRPLSAKKALEILKKIQEYEQNNKEV